MQSHWTANTTAYQDRSATGKKFDVSLEMFPPTNQLAQKSFDEAWRKLAVLNPEFVSVTCGAGGTANASTLEAINRLQHRQEVSAAAHLTCINKSALEVKDEVAEYQNNAVDHIVALRGDLPLEGSETAGDYRSALDLVRDIRPLGDFTISVAAYPEGHPEAKNIDDEIAYLKCKVEAGANQIITQFFFDTEVFLKFIEHVRDAGITVPVIPGILPIVNFERAVSFAEKCGTQIPRWYHVMYRDLDESPELQKAISISIAVEQCRQLMAFGVDRFHFYTLNQSELTLAICKQLGYQAEATAVSLDKAMA